MIEYRLSWQMPDPFWAAGHEHCKHHNDFSEIWNEIPWRDKPTENISTDLSSLMPQFKTLRDWEENKTQPIKNVQLTQRTIRVSEWIPMSPVTNDCDCLTITCPQCSMTSHNPNDVAQRYCGNCHEYHDRMTSGTTPDTSR